MEARTTEPETPEQVPAHDPARGKPATSYRIAGLLLPRLIACDYLIALLSWGVQWRGLVGSDGIMPLDQMMETIRAVEERDQTSLFWQFPTLFHWNAGDSFVQGVIITGVVLSILVVIGFCQAGCLLGLWMVYLSLVVTGNVFMGFQWDALLLEAGLLAVFIAPWRLFAPFTAGKDPPRFALLLFQWLIFRLMFLSGFVKWAGGDPSWRDLTALLYHYETQPLPNALSWFAHQLPGWMQRMSCAGMHVIEILLPFAIVFGKWGRRTAALGFVTLMTLIMLTGNYTYFNLLTLVIAVSLLDDSSWPKRVRSLLTDAKTKEPAPSTTSLWRQPRQWPALAFAPVCLLCTLAAADAFLEGRVSGHQRRLPNAIHSFHNAFASLRSFNAYGLFQSMTRERPEITIEVSDDGIFWLPIEFKWKPGDLSQRPAQAAPHQPRLDWQMWFAALSPGFIPERDSHPNSPTHWFGQLVLRLLQHKQPVWDLVKPPPIPIESITHVRARLSRYHFTTPNERRQSGHWWRAEAAGFYCPPLSLPPAAD